MDSETVYGYVAKLGLTSAQQKGSRQCFEHEHVGTYINMRWQ
jgi:predicted RNA binding protein YcfA (HicA-like mRNA interferase family)